MCQKLHGREWGGRGGLQPADQVEHFVRKLRLRNPSQQFDELAQRLGLREPPRLERLAGFPALRTLSARSGAQLLLGSLDCFRVVRERLRCLRSLEAQSCSGVLDRLFPLFGLHQFGLT